MHINANTSIHSNKTTLVPYCRHHVPTYHEWMKDPEIQIATASEPLTLEEEYGMQESWRSDGDKLTFIITLPTKEAEEGEMIGDVNLFISQQDSDDDHDLKPDSKLVGELELMIATQQHRGQGFGRAAIVLFLWYILTHEQDILNEYHDSKLAAAVAKPRQAGENAFEYFAVKIGQRNEKSIRLFESLGFRRVQEEPNYFGEYELRLRVTREDVLRILARYEITEI